MLWSTAVTADLRTTLPGCAHLVVGWWVRAVGLRVLLAASWGVRAGLRVTIVDDVLANLRIF